MPATRHVVALSAAVTVDGFLAGEGGDLSFLEPFQGTGEDFGLDAFMASVDSLLMGAETYRFILANASSWPYDERPTWILTHSELAPFAGADIRLASGDVREVVEEIRATGAEKTWVVGGGDVVRQLLERDLLDELELAVMPVLLGSGIPLFPPQFPPRRLELLDARSFSAGVALLRYRVAR